MKKMSGFFFVFLMAFTVVLSAAAGSVTNQHYVYLDNSGEYTGSVDTNNIPFGFGVFVCSSPLSGEAWHYVGMWENGLPEGEGTIYFENGNMEKGTFSSGTLVEGFQFNVTGLSAIPVTVERTLPETNALYIGNKKSLRFHLPSCNSVSTMKDKNKIEFSSREEAIERGYKPCGACNP